MNGFTLTAALTFASAAALAFTQTTSSPPPSGMTGPGMMGPGMMGPGMIGQGMMGQGMMGQGMMGQHGMTGGMMMGSMARHHYAMMSGIPERYRSARNPLPVSAATLHRGAQVYAENCAACHGSKGYGDGPAGQQLSPRPANIAWLGHSRMFGDQYVYWTVAEGGQPVGSAMPAFKGNLPQRDIWAVVTYVRNGLRSR